MLQSIESKAVALHTPVGYYDKPLTLGPYYLLKEQGKGSFGVAAVLRRHFNVEPVPSVVDMVAQAQLFIVKRFRAEPEAGDIESQQDPTWKRKAFTDERQRASWLRSMIRKHPNLVEYITDIPDSATGTDAMVFEYCNGGDIRQLIAKCKDANGNINFLTLYEALYIAEHLSAGLAALAEQHIVHRDISLRNIFVDLEPSGKLIFKIGGKCRLRYPFSYSSLCCRLRFMPRPWRFRGR